MTDTPDFNLDEAIQAINHHGSKMAWLRRGRFLEEANKKHTWATRGDGTFGSMLTNLAEAQGVHRGVLWREIKAVRYLEGKLRPKLEMNGIPVPADEDLPTGVNSEVLDILERVERVVPHDEFLKQAKIVIRGEMIRHVFRSYWNAVKPALDGRTARGRGEPPVVEYRADSFVEQRIMAHLVEQGPQWLDTKKPHGYAFILDNSTLRVCGSICGGYMPDAIAVVQRTTDPSIELHGIELMSMISVDTPKFKTGLNAFDRFWLFARDEPDLDWLAKHQIPVWVGLIRAEFSENADDGTDKKIILRQVREAALNPVTTEMTDAVQRYRLLEALYAQTIKHFPA